MKRAECTPGLKVKRLALACCAGMRLDGVKTDRTVGQIVGEPYKQGNYMVLVKWSDGSESPVSISRLEKA